MSRKQPTPMSPWTSGRSWPDHPVGFTLATRQRMGRLISRGGHMPSRTNNKSKPHNEEGVICNSIGAQGYISDARDAPAIAKTTYVLYMGCAGELLRTLA